MEVVTELRARWPASTVRIVAVTADAFEDTRDQARTAAPAQPLTRRRALRAASSLLPAQDSAHPSYVQCSCVGPLLSQRNQPAAQRR
jgi:hypothetical protein